MQGRLSGAQKVSSPCWGRRESEGACELGEGARNPIRVLHFIATLNRGGAETALSRLVEASDPDALKHVVVALRSGGPLQSVIERAGGEVVVLGVRGPMSLLRTARSLARLGAYLRPDIIQGWMVHGNLAAWLVRVTSARTAKLAWNLRVTADDLVFERRFTRFLTSVAARLSRRVELLISNSHVSLDQHIRLGYRARSAVVIPNGFDLSLFKPSAETRSEMREMLGLTSNCVAFGLVGRFHPQKGHRVFVEAANLLCASHSDARYVFVGEGLVDNPQVDQLFCDPRTRERTIVLGGRGDIHRLMQALDVVCLPSFYEGFPNVMGEAMASAVACIATDVSDVRGILGGGGIVIPKNDVEALMGAMVSMLSVGCEGRERYGRQGRSRIEQEYSLAAVVHKYTEVYVRLVGGSLQDEAKSKKPWPEPEASA